MHQTENQLCLFFCSCDRTQTGSRAAGGKKNVWNSRQIFHVNTYKHIVFISPARRRSSSLIYLFFKRVTAEGFYRCSLLDHEYAKWSSVDPCGDKLPRLSPAAYTEGSEVKGQLQLQHNLELLFSSSLCFLFNTRQVGLVSFSLQRWLIKLMNEQTFGLQVWTEYLLGPREAGLILFYSVRFIYLFYIMFQ